MSFIRVFLQACRSLRATGGKAFLAWLWRANINPSSWSVFELCGCFNVVLLREIWDLFFLFWWSKTIRGGVTADLGLGQLQQLDFSQFHECWWKFIHSLPLFCRRHCDYDFVKENGTTNDNALWRQAKLDYVCVCVCVSSIPVLPISQLSSWAHRCECDHDIKGYFTIRHCWLLTISK